MTSIAQGIDFAEAKWLPLISLYLQNLYNGIHLPSHNLSHHIRVWVYCKELLFELDQIKEFSAAFSIEQALIACMFHDTGLIADKSERHGYQSKLQCIQFFEQNPTHITNNPEFVLHAIEHHDDKNLKHEVNFDKFELDLVTLVSSADDLDALGLIGVFRYLEIYNLRGIPELDIPHLVLKNLANRFTNFKNHFPNLPLYVKRQEQRYRVTLNFFEQLRDEGKSVGVKNGSNRSIARCLVQKLIHERLDIEPLIQNIISSNLLDLDSKQFFENLKAELLR